MLRRLHPEQPDSFAFTPENQAWAEAQITKYPEGRQASAIIPLLWRAQEQEGWLTRPAIEYVSSMLDLAFIRGLEVASFYFMFQLQPVGSVAHIQVCGTTSCMICGAEDLISVCKEKIASQPHHISDDGKLSWEEVECLGACANAPMALIGKDYYEDLTSERFGEMIDAFRRGDVPVPGSQNGRYSSEPLQGLTSLKDHDAGRLAAGNASVALAGELSDTVRRIDGSEVPLRTPWLGRAGEAGGDVQSSAAEKSGAKRELEKTPPNAIQAPAEAAQSSEPQQVTQKDTAEEKAQKTDVASEKQTPQKKDPSKETASQAEAGVDEEAGTRPAALEAARDGGADDLKQIKGVGPKLEALLHRLGFFHFDQLASWTADEVRWVDLNLEGFKGRVSRDNWVEQAKILADGGATEFSQKVKKGGVYEKK